MNKSVSINDIMPLLIEKLKSGGKCSFTPRGNSMNPLFRSGRDSVNLEQINNDIKKYDIILYKRKNKYILHRVINVGKKQLVLRGDNQLVDEYGVNIDSVVGIVTSFTRRNKTIEATNRLYRLYTVIWVNTVIIRRTYKIITVLIKKIKRKILG